MSRVEAGHDEPAELLARAINVSTAASCRVEAAHYVGQARQALPAGHPALSFLDRAREADTDQRTRHLLREALQVCEGGDSLHD